MKIILLSGGSGSRLWPLSNDARSKQFIKVLGDKKNKMSMLQRVWNQIKEIGLDESVIITTTKSQGDMIMNQIGTNIQLVIEPERRDTYPAIALASSYLYSELKIDPNESVIVCPVDPYVDVDFFNTLSFIDEVLNTTSTNLALLGVNPTYPAAKYGYIIPVQGNEPFMNVKEFREKPNEDDAKKLIDQGALWNCGVFGFKLKYIIQDLQKRGFSGEYKELVKEYCRLPKISFDYEIVEKAEEVKCIKYDGYWKDLGTWNTLTEEMGIKVSGNAVISNDSLNTHVINELDIPIKVLGVKDSVIVASPDGILVSEKSASPRLKELLETKSVRPMYEERRWGWYKVLDYQTYDENVEVLTKHLCVEKGKYLSYQFHLKRREVWTIIKGTGLFILDDRIRSVQKGDVLIIPVGTKHSIKAVTDLEFIEVQDGSELIEEDIVRLPFNWDDLEVETIRL